MDSAGPVLAQEQCGRNQVGQLSWYQRVAWKTWLLAAFWLAAFAATHMPKVPQAVGHVSDKTWHFATYATLACLLSWVWESRFAKIWTHSAIVIGTLATYAAIDEVLQIPVGRQCDFHDWVADMIGATCGCLAFHVAQRTWRWFRK